MSLFSNEKNKISIIKNDATNLYNIDEKFDIIFMDAPYNKGLSEKALYKLMEKKWLADDGICIIETAANENLQIDKQLTLIDKRKYGAGTFWFLQYSN